MRLLGTIALSALLATGLAACGDDDDGGGGEALELEEVPAGDGGDDADDDESDDTTTTTEGDDSGDDEGDDDGPLFGELGEDCELLLEATTALGEAFSGTGSDIDFDVIAQAYAEFAANAPEAVAGDAAILAEAFGQFAEALDGVDLNDPSSFQDPEIAARLTEAAQLFSDPAFIEANTNFTTFLTTECSGAG